MIDYKKLARKLHMSIAIPPTDAEASRDKEKVEENKKRLLAKNLEKVIQKNMHT